MDQSTSIYKALSDKNRLRILKALQSKYLCVCETRELLGLALSTVSQHLRMLKDTGFIIEERDGKWVNFKINPQPSDQRITTILSNLDYWINDENLITNDIKKVETLNRNTIIRT